MKFIWSLIAILTVFSTTLRADEEAPRKVALEAGFDLATTYLWRGFEIGDGPVIQPWTRLNYGGWSAGVWATTNFIGDSKEVDLTVGYTFQDFTLSLTDLFSVGITGLDPDYFNFASRTSSHIAELGLSYEGSEKIPFSFTAGVFVYGLSLDPNAVHPDRMNHSVYLEMGYLGTVKDYNYQLFAGFVPMESSFYETERFSFINVGFKVEKTLSLGRNMELPASFTLATSPERKTICLSALCSF
jgi:hypothetical protein